MHFSFSFIKTNQITGIYSRLRPRTARLVHAVIASWIGYFVQTSPICQEASQRSQQAPNQPAPPGSLQPISSCNLRTHAVPGQPCALLCWPQISHSVRPSQPLVMPRKTTTSLATSFRAVWWRPLCLPIERVKGLSFHVIWYRENWSFLHGSDENVTF